VAASISKGQTILAKKSSICPFTGILLESRLFFSNRHPKIRHRFSLAFYIMPNPKNEQ
jgi:hypothetical protein